MESKTKTPARTRNWCQQTKTAYCQLYLKFAIGHCNWFDIWFANHRLNIEDYVNVSFDTDNDKTSIVNEQDELPQYDAIGVDHRFDQHDHDHKSSVKQCHVNETQVWTQLSSWSHSLCEIISAKSHREIPMKLK